MLYNKGLTMTTKGKKLTYNWGDEPKTITQILSDPQHGSKRQHLGDF